jgi:hypothetical protein
MPIYLTPQEFQRVYTKHIKRISIGTVYRWKDEGNLEFKNDHGGHGVLIIIDEEDLLFPFLVRDPKRVVLK